MQLGILQETKQTNRTMNTPTPETDEQSFSTVYQGNLVYANFARKLERERNDLRNAISGLCEHFKIHPASATFLAIEILRIERQRNEMAEILADILAYDKGEKPHDYWKLPDHAQADAMAFDAWQKILRKIEQALETKP